MSLPVWFKDEWAVVKDRIAAIERLIADLARAVEELKKRGGGY